SASWMPGSALESPKRKCVTASPPLVRKVILNRLLHIHDVIGMFKYGNAAHVKGAEIVNQHVESEQLGIFEQNRFNNVDDLPMERVEIMIVNHQAVFGDPAQERSQFCRSQQV